MLSDIIYKLVCSHQALLVSCFKNPAYYVIIVNSNQIFVLLGKPSNPVGMNKMQHDMKLLAREEFDKRATN
jgi:hypothetical protein